MLQLNYVLFCHVFILQCIVNKDFSSCILLVFSEFIYNPATLKRRRTAFCLNVANYASRRTALFIATFGSCNVMPCYQ